MPDQGVAEPEVRGRPGRKPPADAGELEFTMASGGKSFTGRWRYDSSGVWHNDWNGTRVSS